MIFQFVVSIIIAVLCFTVFFLLRYMRKHQTQ
ncbi:hypothetical protein R84B8_01876 [Treponema sp. R8-4-B8]